MAEEPTYQQEIEAGKAIITKMLEQLATELEEPQITDLIFTIVDNDIDYQQESLFDPKHRKTVMKISQEDLADAPETQRVRSKLQGQISAAVKTYFQKCECGHAQSSHVGGNGACSERIASFEKRTEDKKNFAVEMPNRVSSSPEEACSCKKFRLKRIERPHT
jgi:hypothetical protein